MKKLVEKIKRNFSNKKATINSEYLKSLKPCADRYANWLKHHKKWSGSLYDFLDLEDITHKDKVWVFFRTIPKEKIRLVAADFAEHVLHLYESKYPNDLRPRKAIESARSGNNAAAYAAAYAAADAAADAAAADAAYAAAAAADAAAYAADAAYAAAAAADAAAYAAKNKGRTAEEKFQIKIMKKYAKECKL